RDPVMPERLLITSVTDVDAHHPRQRSLSITRWQAGFRFSPWNVARTQSPIASRVIGLKRLVRIRRNNDGTVRLGWTSQSRGIRCRLTIRSHSRVGVAPL